MNQILFTKKNKKGNKKYIFLLFISMFFIFVFIIYELYFYFSSYRKEKLSYNILNSFNLEKLYSSKNQEYTVVELNGNNNFFTIGIIEISKINIRYPILSTVDDELLKISPCRFYGPFPNEIGNLCIAAHNYDDNRFFGNLDKLGIGDKIDIYDSNNIHLSYYVYEKFETFGYDTSCTSQDTNNKREITLVTCNNINKKRLIIKAKE